VTTKTWARAWTRVTTIANTLADRYALEQWAQRQTVIGLGAREDLYALAASTTPDDRDQLTKIVSQAQEAAKSRSGANLGTALHKLTERIDSGEILDVPAQWRPDVDAYCQTLADNRVRIHPEWIERVVVIPEMGAAGTLDRMVTVGDDLTLRVADLKTGASADEYGHTEIAIQLSLYAHATHVWKRTTDDIRRDQYGRYLLPDPEDDPYAYDEMPTVDQATALMMHLPVGEGRCSLYEVDIKSGIVAAGYATWVREWRKRKDLAWPFNPAPFNGGGATEPTTTDDDW
jgi:hypothetical protein